MPKSQRRSGLRNWHSFFLVVVPFVCGCQVYRLYPLLVDVNYQDICTVANHLILFASYITKSFFWTITSGWRMHGQVSLQKAWAMAMDFSFIRNERVVAFGALFFVMLLVGVVVWTLIQLRRRRKDRRYLRPDIKGDDGMEILRTTRDRSSTFDFFGTHSEVLQRERASSSSSRAELMVDIRRERVGSMDLFYSQREALKKDQRPMRRLSNTVSHPSDSQTDWASSRHQASFRDEGDDEGYLFDEFGLVTLSYDLVYYGPSETSLRYETWTSPTSWAEVSRRIVPQDIMLKLRRILEIELNRGHLSIKEPKFSKKWELSLPAEDFSIHVQQPAEGAVLDLYVKPTIKEEWMEHTFQSAQHAAQFQLDLLAYQVLGKTLNNLFHSLSLVHSGSIACEQAEHVLHHAAYSPRNEESERASAVAGVAWDDAMRALSSIPTIRIALERLWLHQCRPVDGYPVRKKRNASPSKTVHSSAEKGLLTEEYTAKRLLLGPVDFFRLFVPALPDTAVPQLGSNRTRMEQLLSWRKRAARASVLAQAYVAAHRVVNLGWEIRSNVEDSSPRILRRRLAYDDNEDNNRRDRSGRDEVYEASVSRDVLCHVRPFDYFSQKEGTNKQKKSLVLSPYQAYALVGIQVFRKPEQYDPAFPLNSARDPVEVISSLREIIASNPDVDFLVSCYHRAETVSILLHARSLAKGIDPQFDNVMTRFTESGAEIRDRKVHMMIQMGHSHALSFVGVLLVRFLSFLFSLTRKGRESPLGLEARRDRVPFPAIRLASYGETLHFGGAIRGNNELPPNYIGITTTFKPRATPNLISRILFCYLEGQLSERVLDFTLVLEGENEDELPERALCTARLVRLDTHAVAKDPAMYGVVSKDRHSRDTEESQSSKVWPRRLVSEFASVLQLSFLTPQKRESAPIVEVTTLDCNAGRKGCMDPTTIASLENSMREAIDDVWDCLEGINVPFQSNQRGGCLQTQGPQGDFGLPNNMVMTPVTSKVSWHDIQRFIISSEYNLQEAAVRIIETAAWRGRTFPTDTRMCRIELQSGQVFQCGCDVFGHPVIYFRTMCRGPWRECADATLAAALHRFDSALSELCSVAPETKCTLVVILGRPGNSTGSDQEGSTPSGIIENENNLMADHEGSGESLFSVDTAVTNPRVSTEEPWNLHCTSDLLERFISLLLTHYPERLSRILLFKGQRGSFYRTQVAASRAMKRVTITRKERSKISFISKFSKLKGLIDELELSTAALGKAAIPAQAFEC